MKDSKRTMTYLAIVDHSCAYVLDVHPDEHDRHLRVMGSKVVGEFATYDEAFAAVGGASITSTPE
jgi:hypothetical protein